MGSLREKAAAVKAALFSTDHQDDALVVNMPRGEEDTNQDDDAQDTGPLATNIRPLRPTSGGAAAPLPSQARPSHFERQRSLIESFDEDYADRWDKIKLLAAKIVAIVLPVIAVLAIGGELGKYFSQFSGGMLTANLIAYAGESAMAALTYILGSIIGRTEKSVSYYVKLTLTFIIWDVFVLASAWGQWAVASSALPAHAPSGLIVAIWLRIGMACLLDAASVAIMFWRGKSLSKFLAQQAQKADATIRVNESELTIQRAQAAAQQREKEDALYLKGKEQAQNVVMRVQELQGEALIEQARNALQLPEGNRDGGRKLRGGSNW